MILFHFFLFLPVIAGIQGSRELQDAPLFLSSAEFPESHVVSPDLDRGEKFPPYRVPRCPRLKEGGAGEFL